MNSSMFYDTRHWCDAPLTPKERRHSPVIRHAASHPERKRRSHPGELGTTSYALKTGKQNHFPNPIKCSRRYGVNIFSTKATAPPEKGHGAPHQGVQCRLTGQCTSGPQDRQLEIPLDVPVFCYQCTKIQFNILFTFLSYTL